MNIPLSLKIERSLHLDEGLLMTLQVYYDIELEKKKEAQSYHPDLSIYRKILFWDTDFDKLDWNTNKRYIINRILEMKKKYLKQFVSMVKTQSCRCWT